MGQHLHVFLILVVLVSPTLTDCHSGYPPLVIEKMEQLLPPHPLLWTKSLHAWTPFPVLDGMQLFLNPRLHPGLYFKPNLFHQSEYTFEILNTAFQNVAVLCTLINLNVVF